MKRENNKIISQDIEIQSNIPASEILDSLEINIDKDIEDYTKNILRFVEDEKSLLNDSSLIAKALSGDMEIFDKITIKMAPATVNDSNFYKYSYYIAEKFDYAYAYYFVFLVSSGQSAKYCEEKICDDNDWPLNNIKEEQKEIALSCLIKSYKKGEISTSKILSYYFREGYYFPKNIDAANELDSIYRRAYPPKHKP